MNFIPKRSPRGSVTQLLLSLIALAATFLSAVFGELFVIAASASLALIMCFEKGGKRVFSICISILVLIISFALGGFYSLIGAEILLVALAISVSVSLNRPKAECAAIVTAIVTACMIGSLALGAISVTGDATAEAIFSYYSDLFDEVKTSFIDSTKAQIEAMPNTPGNYLELVDSVALLFDSFIYSMISFLVIASFAVAGFTLKLFSYFITEFSDDGSRIYEWRFTLSSITAYATAIIIILSFFASNSTDLFSLTVVNLYNIFSIVFAYVGFRTALSFISSKLGVFKAWLILILAMILAFSLAEQLLAMLGIYATIITNRLDNSGDLGGSDGDGNF